MIEPTKVFQKIKMERYLKHNTEEFMRNLVSLRYGKIINQLKNDCSFSILKKNECIAFFVIFQTISKLMFILFFGRRGGPALEKQNLKKNVSKHILVKCFLSNLQFRI